VEDAHARAADLFERRFRSHGIRLLCLRGAET
jgi:hypothetical protein